MLRGGHLGTTEATTASLFSTSTFSHTLPAWFYTSWFVVDASVWLQMPCKSTMHFIASVINRLRCNMLGNMIKLSAITPHDILCIAVGQKRADE